MKELKFKTSKGRFVIKDLNFIPLNCNGIKLSEITEKQASEIVDLKGDRFQDYNHVSCCDRWCNTAKESLHSLLKSKGIHLFENPNDSDYFTNRSTEQKTFYKPYIFKL